MSVFTDVKEHLRLRDVAAYYGLKANRAGFVCCPFHKEKTPSMKLYDDHFYCFGCQSSGDVITLVEKLFGLQPLDAARKLQHDFGLADVSYDYEKESRAYLEKKKSVQRELAFQKWKAETYLLFTDYASLLRQWRSEYEPKNMEDAFHPLYEESLRELEKTEYYCDLFLYGTDEDIRNFKEYEERLVKNIADRIHEYGRNGMGRTHTAVGYERGTPDISG